MTLADITVLADGLDHPEGVATGPDGTLYAGGEAGQVYRIDPDGTTTQLASTGGFALGLALDAAGRIYVCDNGHHAVLRVDTDGSVHRWSSGTEAQPMRTPNYPVFDDTGRLYVSDSGSFDGHDGCLWVVEPDGSTHLLSTDTAAFPNGLALSPDGAWLYVVQSNGPDVVRLPLADGRQAGPVERVVDLPGTVPDGIAFDEAGGLWIALYAPDRILRLDPSGQLATIAEDPRRVLLASPTNLTFAGPDRTQLAIGSLARWHIATMTVAIPGARLHYPEVLA
jgi:gluconolactonase